MNLQQKQQDLILDLIIYYDEIKLIRQNMRELKLFEQFVNIVSVIHNPLFTQDY